MTDQRIAIRNWDDSRLIQSVDIKLSVCVYNREYSYGIFGHLKV